MRFDINYNYNPDNIIIFIHSQILMKSIEYIVTVDNTKIKKPKSPLEIQNFYGFIRRNVFIIKEIKTDELHFFLKDNQLHSYDCNYCYKNLKLGVIYYANKGNILSDEQVDMLKRKKKIRKIKESIQK